MGVVPGEFEIGGGAPWSETVPLDGPGVPSGPFQQRRTVFHAGQHVLALVEPSPMAGNRTKSQPPSLSPTCGPWRDHGPAWAWGPRWFLPSPGHAGRHPRPRTVLPGHGVADGSDTMPRPAPRGAAGSFSLRNLHVVGTSSITLIRKRSALDGSGVIPNTPQRLGPPRMVRP